MKRTDTEPTEGFDWNVESTAVEQSWSERLREYYQIYVYEPGVVAWSDIRMRVGLFLLGIYLTVAAVAYLGLWRQPTSNQAERMLGMFENLAYPLGTNASGVDLTAAIIHSTPYILLMVLAGGIWATSMAVIVGTVSGYKGGRVDTVLMWISDFFMAIPGLPLVIVLAIAISPQNPIFVGVILTINYWAGLGRSLRSQVLTIREDSYVEASRAMGVSTPKIIWKDVIPNLMPYITVNFVFAARYTIFASIGLYFLGVLPYQGSNWGVMLQRAYSNGGLFVPDAAHWIIAPMIAVVGLALALILIAQGLDRVFNPAVRSRMAGKSESVSAEDEEEVQTGGAL